jgi:hypothetical protein
MSQKNVTKVAILLLAAGFLLLATCHWIGLEAIRLGSWKAELFASLSA